MHMQYVSRSRYHCSTTAVLGAKCTASMHQCVAVNVERRLLEVFKTGSMNGLYIRRSPWRWHACKLTSPRRAPDVTTCAARETGREQSNRSLVQTPSL